MEDWEKYKGREQSYIKHLVLKKYIERLIYKVALGARKPKYTITYVDGFSGPWKTRTTDYSDTSFYIAITQLIKAKEA